MVTAFVMVTVSVLYAIISSIMNVQRVLKFFLKMLLGVAVVAACALVYFCLADASSMVTWGVVLVVVGTVATLLRRRASAGHFPLIH